MGVLLPTDPIYRAVLSIVGYFLGRPLGFAYGFVGAGIEQADISHCRR